MLADQRKLQFCTLLPVPIGLCGDGGTKLISLETSQHLQLSYDTFLHNEEGHISACILLWGVLTYITSLAVSIIKCSCSVT
jgi:hypothetical protein